MFVISVGRRDWLVAANHVAKKLSWSQLLLLLFFFLAAKMKGTH